MDNSTNMKEKILTCVKTFIDELCMSFDYIKNGDQLTKYYSKLEKNETEFSNFIKQTTDLLKPYELCITNVVLTERKIKTSEYQFLSNIKLFGGLLDLSFFSNENKNTKKMLTKYLHTLYFTSYLYTLSDINSADLEEHLKQLMESFNENEHVNGSEQQEDNKRGNQNRRGNESKTEMETIMNSMFSSPDLFNIASELTNDLQNQNVNPMSLIQNLMTGNMDGQLGGLIQNMTEKLESKIASGDLDIKQLEEQTQKMMSQLPMGDLMKNLGGLGSLGKK